MTEPLERIARAVESIARDVHELRQAAEPHVDVLAAYQRGGKIAAWTAARRRSSSQDHAAQVAAGHEEDGHGG